MQEMQGVTREAIENVGRTGALRQQLASPALERYAASGTLPIHNNLVEKAIRSMVIGKFKLNTLLRWRGLPLTKKAALRAAFMFLWPFFIDRLSLAWRCFWPPSRSAHR
jgi:hypothetical protein